MIDLDALRRWPDIEAPELRAWDTADTLMLDEVASMIDGVSVTVIGDNYGALTLGALDRGARGVRVHQDRLSGERALVANAHRLGPEGFTPLYLGPELVNGARLALLRLPRSLDALDQIAGLVAALAHPEVVLVAGARVKHMTTRMNEVLERHFGRLDVSRARQKSRLLIARDPQPGPLIEPRRRWHADLGIWVVATSGVFAGTAIDMGTRELLRALDGIAPVETAVDLGCGTGVLAAGMARQGTAARVLASDESAAAVESARMTAQANGVEVTVTRDDALEAHPGASIDLMVLNPPFHSGATVHSGVSTRLFRAAARVLKPGGELYTVWNSHLQYRPTLERIVGPTRQISRTPKFTVTASRRR